MGTDTGASDIGSPDRAHRGLPAFGYGADEFVDQVRVGTAVSGALDEGDVIGIYNLFPLCKALDGFWKTCQYIRDLDPACLFAALKQTDAFILNLRPFTGQLITVDIKAFPVLTDRVVEGPRCLGPDMAVREGHGTCLNCKRRSISAGK